MPLLTSMPLPWFDRGSVGGDGGPDHAPAIVAPASGGSIQPVVTAGDSDDSR